jgi:hypothetical protein
MNGEASTVAATLAQRGLITTDISLEMDSGRVTFVSIYRETVDSAILRYNTSQAALRAQALDLDQCCLHSSRGARDG